MKKLSLLLCLLWMAFIFYNSSQTGQESNDKSTDILISISNKIDKINNGTLSNKVSSNFGESSISKTIDKYISKINLFFRKFAHAFEFLVLAILIGWVMKNFGIRGWNMVIYTLFIVLLYAVLDEYHQLYVVGRNSNIRDVMIDFVGGIIGISLFKFIIHKFKGKHFVS